MCLSCKKSEELSQTSGSSSVDHDWMDVSWARRRSSTLSDFFEPKNIALFKIRQDQKVFDQQCDAARRHTLCTGLRGTPPSRRCRRRR